MPTIADIRAQYPQYSDMSDAQLASALHAKFYSDMPEDVFRQKIGLGTQKAPAQIPSAGEHVREAANLVREHPLTVGVGMAENALSGVTAGVGSLADAVTGSDPGTHDFTYRPRTEAGQEIARLTAQEAGKVGQVYDKVAGTGPLATTLKERVPEALGAVGTVTGAAGGARFVPGVAKVAGRTVAEPLAATARQIPAVRAAAARTAQAGEEAAAVRAAEAAPKAAKIEQAKAIGLKLDPTEAGGPVGKTLAGVGGKVQTEMALSRDNAKVINRTAGNEIGLSERQPLTEGNIEREKLKQFAVYKQVKSAGRIATDDTYREELNAVRERTAQAEEDFPEDTNEAIDKEIRKFDKPSADASSLVEKIKSLRNRASANMKALDAEKFELGLAQKKIATAMENLLDRHLSSSNPTLISEFRAARTRLAKIYSVEDALSPNGNVSAAVLARQLKRGVPLSGGLRTIAETYQEFPRVMRYVDNLGGHGPFSALDYLVGGVEAAVHPAKAPAIIGAIVGRPIARQIIRSKSYQSRGIGAHPVKPSITTRAARKIAGPTLADLEDTQ